MYVSKFKHRRLHQLKFSVMDAEAQVLLPVSRNCGAEKGATSAGWPWQVAISRYCSYYKEEPNSYPVQVNLQSGICYIAAAENNINLDKGVAIMGRVGWPYWAQGTRGGKIIILNKSKSFALIEF